jgi:tetratricopeptide (TPR) repeat protein
MEPSDPAKRFVVGTERRDNSLDIKVSGSEIPYSPTVGETQLLAGHVEEAHAHATGALALARRRQERGHRAYALRLLGKIAARHKPPERDQAEAPYQQALTLVEELGMRPLAAQCHRSLGELYVSLARRDDACVELWAAIAVYRAMDMTFWLSQTEAALVQVMS